MSLPFILGHTLKIKRKNWELGLDGTGNVIPAPYSRITWSEDGSCEFIVFSPLCASAFVCVCAHE